jgi:spermidine synthase
MPRRKRGDEALMLPWILLGSAPIPGDGGEMRLHQRGSEYSIRVGGYELMNSRVHGSEDALASLVCERMRERPAARLLIGGLGMGFTLAGVLRDAGPAARVVVAELVLEVVRWNRDVLGAVAGHPLRDPRVTVREEDVAAIMRSERAGYDAILLDVDNGPSALTARNNHWLYGPAGLRAAFAALRPKGILAVWSADDDPAFTRRLQQAGFTAEQVKVRARGTAGGSRFRIWLATR